MSTRHADLLGRFRICAVDHAPVWPFLRDAVVEVRSAGPAGVLVRVSTAGGALLRSFAGHDDAQGLRVTGLEARGQNCALRLRVARDGSASDALLVGSFEPDHAAANGTPDVGGGWSARMLAELAAPHAA